MQKGHEFEEKKGRMYGLNVPSPNLYVATLTPNMIAFGGGPLGGN